MTPSLRIAVADDEKDMRDYFQKMLPRLGHQVVAVAHDGRELVEQCRGLQPDLVITDYRMPELDGLEACAALQHEHPVPVILVSACFDAALLACAEQAHVVGILVKPLRQADLGPAIAEALSRFHQIGYSHLDYEELREKANLLSVPAKS
jgi:response regulator NasT